MNTIVSLLLCLLLGIFWKAQGVGALFWLPLGFVFGLFTTAQIVLPILMGIPRAIRLIRRGKVRAGIFIRLLAGPAVFAALLYAIELLVGFLWPSIAESVAHNGALNAGCWLGIIAIILSPLSRRSRSDFRDDFDRAYHAYDIMPEEPNWNSAPEADTRYSENPSAIAEFRSVSPQHPVTDEGEELQDDLLDFTIIGASHMARGLTEFPAWSEAMLAEKHSEDIRPFLRVIFVNSKNMLERTKKSFDSRQ